MSTDRRDARVRRYLSQPESRDRWLVSTWYSDLVSQAIGARTHAGLTQRDIAERMGTTQSAIARLENDLDARVGAARLFRYLATCGVIPMTDTVPLEDALAQLDETPSKDLRLANFAAGRNGHQEPAHVTAAQVVNAFSAQPVIPGIAAAAATLTSQNAKLMSNAVAPWTESFRALAASWVMQSPQFSQALPPLSEVFAGWNASLPSASFLPAVEKDLVTLRVTAAQHAIGGAVTASGAPPRLPAVVDSRSQPVPSDVSQLRLRPVADAPGFVEFVRPSTSSQPTRPQTNSQRVQSPVERRLAV